MPRPLHQRSSPAFLEVLSGWDMEDLERDSSLIIGTWNGGTIGYFNPAWVEAAESRGAGPGFWSRWGVGANIHAAGGRHDPRQQQPARGPRGTGPADVAKQLYYRCDGPAPGDEHLYCARTFPLGPAGDATLEVHSEVTVPDMLEVGEGLSLSREKFAGVGGLVIQCSHCKRLRLAGNPETWVEGLGEHRDLQPISHGLCPVCFNIFATAR